MKYKVLIVKNSPAIDPYDAEQMTRLYFLERSPLEIEYETITLERPVVLGSWGISSSAGEHLVGTIGTRQTLQSLNIRGAEYNAIIYLYDLAKTAWFKTHLADESLRVWTHWEPYQGAALIEIPTFAKWSPYDLFRMMTHELLHAFHQACRLNGTTTVDTMDLFDKEEEVEAPDGNRARNIKTLAPYWQLVPHQPLLAALFRTLKLLVEAYQLKASLKSMNTKFETWALAIRRHEGWYEGSRSHRNNNPANAKFFSGGYNAMYGNVGKDADGFAVFPSYTQGWTYLVNLIRSACVGTSAIRKPDFTLYEFFAGRSPKEGREPEGGFAPKKDGNDPEHYAEVVAEALGVSPDIEIKNIIA